MITINEAVEVIKLLPNEFDSHDFLQQYALCYTWSYLLLLKDSKDVQRLHMSIGAFLKNNEASLSIEKVGERTTINIFGNMVECALWNKKIEEKL